MRVPCVCASVHLRGIVTPALAILLSLNGSVRGQTVTSPELQPCASSFSTRPAVCLLFLSVCPFGNLKSWWCTRSLERNFNCSTTSKKRNSNFQSLLCIGSSVSSHIFFCLSCFYFPFPFRTFHLVARGRSLTGPWQLWPADRSWKTFARSDSSQKL